MKALVWTLGLSFALTNSLSAQSQPPAATLGLPRASLGLPMPARNPAPVIQAANFAEPSPPILTPPAPAPVVVPDRLGTDPKPMPYGPAPDAGVKQLHSGPIVSGPLVAPPIDTEAPLFDVPSGARPFVGGDRFRLSAEYLMWWTNGYSVPALVTTGPVASGGALGQPGVSTLFGNQTINTGFSSGVRTGYEWWFGRCQNWAFDGHMFLLSQVGQTAGFASFGSPLLARPFFNVNSGVQTAEIVAAPGSVIGGIDISSKTSLYGADINMRRKLCQGCNTYFDGLFGYRFLSLQETLTIAEQSSQLPPINPAFPASGTAFDRFHTTNQFNGGQIGAAMGCTKGNWVFDLRSMVAIGETSSILYVDGAHNFVSPNSSGPGGLLALNSNSGRFSHNAFSVVPELTMNIGYNLSQHCRIYVGYNFLFWSGVLRPGNQIDPNLDVTRIPGFGATVPPVATPHPTVPLTTRDFYAQGINLGLMLHW